MVLTYSPVRVLSLADASSIGMSWPNRRSPVFVAVAEPGDVQAHRRRREGARLELLGSGGGGEEHTRQQQNRTVQVEALMEWAPVEREQFG